MEHGKLILPGALLLTSFSRKNTVNRTTWEKQQCEQGIFDFANIGLSFEFGPGKIAILIEYPCILIKHGIFILLICGKTAVVIIYNNSINRME